MMTTPIKEQLSSYNTLFLDRDGTINKRWPNDYVKSRKKFEFLPGVLEALYLADSIFENIIVVTNQQGVGKGLMLKEELIEIHDHMMDVVIQHRGRIDQIYACTELSVFDPWCRKPNPGMAFQAKEDFPSIDLKRSIMIGDTESDMVFGRRVGMYTVLIDDRENQKVDADLRVASLLAFMKILVK